MNTRTILLNPGPVTLSSRVRDALASGDWCHREFEFAELTQSINSRLASVYAAADPNYRAVLLTGSGTCTVEAMLATFAPADTKTLIAANGVYGERMASMLQAMGRPAVVVSSPWTAPIDLEAVEQTLDEDPRISHVVAVHHETTTGRLNAIGDLGELCVARNVSLMLDAVSSYGAEEIKFRDWNVIALAGTANKCLHSVPGLSFVIADEKEFLKDRHNPGSVYLDLARYYHTQHGDGYSPFTLAVQAALALDVALEEMVENGGWEARRQRYTEIGQSVRSCLKGLGVQTLIPEAELSSVMSSYRLPGTSDYQSLHDTLKERGFIIYAGQGDFSEKIFRIAHMGDIRDDDVRTLNESLTAYFGTE
jgi:2-aminoethylphosphonate-pyruvate transaminase